MAQYLESGLYLSFSSGFWKTRQYDLHNYYKGMSSRGYKGADFVGLYKEDHLVIIEVKNYSYSRAALPDVDKIVEEIHRKTVDTLIGLDAIRQMLERKWLYRNLSFVLPFLPAHSYDWPFWFRVSKLLRDKKKISLLVILMGVPENLKKGIAGQLGEELVDDVEAIHVSGVAQVIYQGLDIETVKEQ